MSSHDAPEMVFPPPEGAEWPSTSADNAATPPGKGVALDPAILTPADADESPEVEMCCDGSGKTAEQHRAESADHKCCIDN
jgi:hypothetical protein